MNLAIFKSIMEGHLSKNEIQVVFALMNGAETTSEIMRVTNLTKSSVYRSKSALERIGWWDSKCVPEGTQNESQKTGNFEGTPYIEISKDISSDTGLKLVTKSGPVCLGPSDLASIKRLGLPETDFLFEVSQACLWTEENSESARSKLPKNPQGAIRFLNNWIKRASSRYQPAQPSCELEVVYE